MCQNLFALHYERQSIEPFNDIVCPTRTDILNMTAIGNIFISKNDERNRNFGVFRDEDIQKLIAKMQTRKQFEIRMLIFRVLVCVLLIIFLH